MRCGNRSIPEISAASRGPVVSSLYVTAGRRWGMEAGAVAWDARVAILRAMRAHERLERARRKALP